MTNHRRDLLLLEVVHIIYKLFYWKTSSKLVDYLGFDCNYNGPQYINETIL